MKIFWKIIATVIFAVIAVLAVSPLIGTVFAMTETESAGLIVGSFVMLITAVLILFAPTVRRGFGRGFLLTGALIFLLPLSTFFLSGIAAGEIVQSSQATAASETEEAAAVIGATIGVGLMTGFSWFVGFLIGTVFLVTGLVLVLGGRREVIVVETQPT